MAVTMSAALLIVELRWCPTVHANTHMSTDAASRSAQDLWAFTCFSEVQLKPLIQSRQGMQCLGAIRERTWLYPNTALVFFSRSSRPSTSYTVNEEILPAKLKI